MWRNVSSSLRKWVHDGNSGQSTPSLMQKSLHSNCGSSLLLHAFSNLQRRLHSARCIATTFCSMPPLQHHHVQPLSSPSYIAMPTTIVSALPLHRRPYSRPQSAIRWPLSRSCTLGSFVAVYKVHCSSWRQSPSHPQRLFHLRFVHLQEGSTSLTHLLAKFNCALPMIG